MANDPFDIYNMKRTVKTTSGMPGPKSAELLAEQKKYDSNALVYPLQVPLAIARGLGATVEDLDGNIFIDFSGGVGALNVGHSNPDVIEAAKK